MEHAVAQPIIGERPSASERRHWRYPRAVAIQKRSTAGPKPTSDYIYYVHYIRGYMNLFT